MSRVPLVDSDKLPDSYDILEKKAGKLPDSVDAVFWNRQPTVRAFSNNPELGKAHVTMNSFLWAETDLSGAEEECIILTVARHLDCRLLWHDHVMLAIENERLSRSEILDISHSDVENLGGSLATVAEYILEYIENQGNVSDSTHESISEDYNDSTVISIIKLAGFYTALSHEVNAIKLDRDPFVGWEIKNYKQSQPP
jgi:hypothetical protein